MATNSNKKVRRLHNKIADSVSHNKQEQCINIGRSQEAKEIFDEVGTLFGSEPMAKRFLYEIIRATQDKSRLRQLLDEQYEAVVDNIALKAFKGVWARQELSGKTDCNRVYFLGEGDTLNQRVNAALNHILCSLASVYRSKLINQAG